MFGVTLMDVTIEAFDASLSKGSLSCTSATGTCSPGKGVFSGTSVIGWPLPFGSSIVSLNLTATLSLELNYNCTVQVAYNSSFHNMASVPALLQVQVCPSTPNLKPNPIDFYDSDNGTIVCESRNGKPAALVSLTVSDPSGGIPASRHGTDSVVVELLSTASPLSNWHNAVVTCRVTNHNCSNINIATGVVHVTYVKVVTLPEVYHTNESNITLDCSAYVIGYPGIRYKFTAPLHSNVSESSYLGGPLFTVPQGQSGLFNCTATNNITTKSVTIVFVVSNTVPTNSRQAPIMLQTPFWIIGLVAGVLVIVVVAVVLGVLCKRGHFSKGKRKPAVQPSGTEQRSDIGSNRARLLIVAEGLVSELYRKTLRTTVVVEYSDSSCSLNDIIEKVEKAISRSSPKFKSVALLLHPSKLGVTLSKVDQADLNCSSIQKEKGEKVRSFMTHLANICLDERVGTRMDILNYSGKAPARLSDGLTKLLGIATTVSKDVFGADTPTGEEGGHAMVADAYFDRNNLGEIVYADLQQPSIKRQTDPRHPDERVIYSEIKR